MANQRVLIAGDNASVLSQVAECITTCNYFDSVATATDYSELAAAMYGNTCSLVVNCMELTSHLNGSIWRYAVISVGTDCNQAAAIEISHALRRAGIRSFMMRPVYANHKEARNDSVLQNDRVRYIRQNVSRALMNMGIMANTLGYHYIREAVVLSCCSHTNIRCLTRESYPMIAEKFNTSPVRVERAIRHAITSAWEHGRISAINDMLNCSALDCKSKPTNSEFIALLTQKVVNELDEHEM